MAEDIHATSMVGGLNGELLVHRVRELEGWRDRMNGALEKLSESHTALLLMERDSANDRRESRAAMERCFRLADEIDHRSALVEQRVRLIEAALPLLEMTSRWVRAGVLTVLGGTVGVGGLLLLLLRAVLIEHAAGGIP